MRREDDSNTATNTLGKFVVGVYFIASSLIATTQFIAYKFSYTPALGKPMIGALYSPINSFKWSIDLISDFPTSIILAWVVGIFIAVLSTITLLILLALLRNKKKSLTGHGSAGWASYEDIKNARLIDCETNKTSIIVGGYQVPKTSEIKYLVHTGPESSLNYAPSRSGKGVSIVIPNLLSYEQSIFALDVKGELWTQTSGYRRDVLGQKVLFHNPASKEEGNARINILEEIRIEDDEAVKDTQLVCEYLIPADSNGGGKEQSSENDHFVTAARSALVGVVLYEIIKYPDQVVSVTGILSSVTDPDSDPRQYFEEMKEYSNPKYSVTHVINQIASEMTNREDREFSSVLSSMTNPLSIYRDPILAKATAKSDFKLMDLVDHEDPVTLYMIIPPSDGGRLRNYFGMLINILCRKLTEQLPDKNYQRHKLLLLLDEFSKLPPLPIIQDSLDHFAGYGVKALIIVQDVQTIIRLYGQNETIQSNCKVRIAFTPNKMETAEMLSKMIGNTTVEEKTQSSQRKSMAVVESSVSESEGLHARPLVSVDEIMRLGVPKLDANERMVEPGASIVFVTGCRPILGVQTPYFMDKEMLRRSAFVAPGKSDEIRTEVIESVDVESTVEEELEEALA